MAQFTFTPKQTVTLLTAMKKTGNQLMFVKDQGVYLMVDGSGPYHGDNCVEYARGLNPLNNPGWWSKAERSLGGDDFGEHLGTDLIQYLDQAITDKLKIKINVTKKSMKVALVR
jgi:hypothetical protein